MELLSGMDDAAQPMTETFSAILRSKIAAYSQKRWPGCVGMEILGVVGVSFHL
jgi:hypothetical protein